MKHFSAVAVWSLAVLATYGRQLLHWLVQSKTRWSNLRFSTVHQSCNSICSVYLIWFSTQFLSKINASKQVTKNYFNFFLNYSYSLLVSYEVVEVDPLLLHLIVPETQTILCVVSVSSISPMCSSYQPNQMYISSYQVKMKWSNINSS